MKTNIIKNRIEKGLKTKKPYIKYKVLGCNDLNIINLVNAEGFEPSTACLEGRCSIQLSYASICCNCSSNLSGWQDSNLRPPAPKAGAITELRYTPSAESKGFEPLVQFPIRMFSKHVLSATQATLLSNIAI